MSDPFKTKEFKSLQKEFYAKLKDELGFEDIEVLDSPKEFLGSWHDSYFTARHNAEEFSEISQYYNSAADILSNFNFESEIEKNIWEKHSLGLSIRKIAKELDLKNWVVHKAIKKYQSVVLIPRYNLSVNLISVRDAVPADDSFILSTWLKRLYHDNDEKSYIGEMNSDDFYLNYEKVIKYILKKPAVWVRIACLKDDPDVIVGYAVIEKNILHWVYTKKGWRELGIAKKLVPPYITHFTHLTDTARIIKPKEWIFNPFLI